MSVSVGRLIEGEEGRDAIHMAIAPVIAGEPLNPGQHVGFLSDGTVGSIAGRVGIVDPFLHSLVPRGAKFWLFLYPNTVTSLRHEWEHPVFGTPAVTTYNPQVKFDLTQQVSAEAMRSRAWLENFAANAKGLTYAEIINAAENYIVNDEHLREGGRFEGCYVPDEFWDHYENVTGRTIAENNRGSFFSCSC